MTSSATDDSDTATETDALLTVVSGWQSVLPVPKHPIQAWIDLMDVVEALCPEWPEMVLSMGPGDYRL